MQLLNNMLPFVAAVLIAITLYDIFITILSHQGAGPITDRWTSGVWNFSLATRYRLDTLVVIKRVGPLMLLGVLLVWYFLLYLGWFLLFYSGGQVLSHKTDASTDALDVVYYVGTTFSTLGLGDYSPKSFPWTLVTSTGAMVASFLVSLAISYLIPIMSAVLARRRTVTSIDLLGRTPKDVLQKCWGADAPGALDDVILNIKSDLIETSYQAHVYPILGFFYFAGSHSSFNGGVCRLLDALLVQLALPERSGNMAGPRLELMLNAIAEYRDNLRSGCERGFCKHTGDHTSLYALIEEVRETCGSSASQAQVRERVQPYEDLRFHLMVFTHYEGRLAPTDGVLKL